MESYKITFRANLLPDHHHTMLIIISVQSNFHLEPTLPNGKNTSLQHATTRYFATS